MTDLSLNLTAIEFYNILVQQSAFNTQLIYEPGYAHIVMAPNSGPVIRLPIEVRPSAKNIPPLNLIVIGEDFGKVAETAKKYELPNVDMQLLVGSEFRKFRKVFGFGSSLLDLKFNLPCCYQVKSVFKFKVFIGTAKQAANPDLYEALDVSAVVNLSMKEDLAIPSSVNNLAISIKDEASTDIFKHLEKTTRFINNSFEQNRSLDHSANVFVFLPDGHFALQHGGFGLLDKGA